MSQNKENIGREIKQLWRIANYYFSKAESLRPDLKPNFLQQKISGIADEQTSATIDELPTEEMKFSAHLGSCAIRLATIEELLYKSGVESKRNKTYSALRQLSDVSQDTLKKNVENVNIFHLLFRNIIAHKEPQGVGKKVYQEMEKFFKARNHEEVYDYMSKSLEEIKIYVKKHYCRAKTK